MRAIFVATVLGLLSTNAFAWRTSTVKECPTKMHVNSTLSFEKPLIGYGFTVFEVSGNLERAYNTVLEAGDYQLTGLMAFTGTKKIRGKLRCLYQTEGVVVVGQGHVEKINGRDGNRMQGWLELGSNNQIERVSVATISLSSVGTLIAKDGNEYPTLYNAFELTLYGNKLESSSKSKMTFSGDLMRIDYSSGHLKYATSSLTLTAL